MRESSTFFANNMSTEKDNDNNVRNVFNKSFILQLQVYVKFRQIAHFDKMFWMYNVTFSMHSSS